MSLILSTFFFSRGELYPSASTVVLLVLMLSVTYCELCISVPV